MHTQQSGVFFLGFFSCVAKKKKKKITMAARFFPRAALGWAVLNFFVHFVHDLLAPTLLIMLLIFDVIGVNVWLFSCCTFCLNYCHKIGQPAGGTTQSGKRVACVVGKAVWCGSCKLQKKAC